MTSAITPRARALLCGLVLALGPTACSMDAGDYPRNEALYVTMRDSVRIAVDVWLPDGLPAEAKIPAIVRATRYWRAQDLPNAAPEQRSNTREADFYNDAGYALVLVDARGSGASYGQRRFELAEDEVADYGEIAGWIAGQPWSNGRIGAYGVSYAGNTAEMLAVNEHAAVKAVAPLFNDFDNFEHLVFPGGLLNVGFLRGWSNAVQLMDMNDICGLRRVEDAECVELQHDIAGVKPVDADTSRALLDEAVAGHHGNAAPFESALEYEFRDDPFGPFDERNVGYRRSPAGHLPQIEASDVAMLVRVGWLDAATVNGALGRFNTISNPQRVWIGPWDHGAAHDADPFNPVDAELDPPIEEQRRDLLAFFDGWLKAGGPEPDTSRLITYYTLGADEWSTTGVWPPEGFERRTWYFGPGGTLVRDTPTAAAGADAYTVDFEATTGTQNRWYTNGGAGDVIYPDRAEEDAKLLTYTSEPMEADVEITGHPVVTLHVASTAPDGAFIVYLEDVAPDGRVTYITEGQLRGVMRQVSGEPPLYWKAGPHHSELREDAAPLVPGEVAEIAFELWATSVLIEEGHRIRIAVAGADRDTFLRYPRDGAVPTLSVQRNAAQASRIEIPMRER